MDVPSKCDDCVFHYRGNGFGDDCANGCVKSNWTDGPETYDDIDRSGQYNDTWDNCPDYEKE